MGNFVSVDRLRIEVEALLREYPELIDDEITRLDTLEGATDIKDVLTRLGQSLGDLKVMQESLQARIDELETRLERFTARVALIRKLIFKVLESANLKKIELPEVTFSLRNNPPRLIGEAPADDLPDDLVQITITRAADLKKIREAIEAGQYVAGFAISNAAPSLVVKVK